MAVQDYGVSFSLKQCRDFAINPEDTLVWLLKKGFRRFRLMSYWNEHEKQPGVCDFISLDKQIQLIEKYDGEITLCLGARQPRWPESHWPDWAWDLPKPDREKALLDYLDVIISRYRGQTSVTSWQLENEALNRGFGTKGDFDRGRLRREYKLVKELDPTRPVVMSTSNSWGLPFRRPIPDSIGFSLYRVMNLHGETSRSKTPVWLYRLRGWIVRNLHRRGVFIHELQLEPWGPKAIWEMSPEQQDESMAVDQIRTNVAFAQATRLQPIDLWGGEWWYWRAVKHKDLTIWDAVKESLDT